LRVSQRLITSTAITATMIPAICRSCVRPAMQ
jgi:hypothetical protein